MKIITLLRVIIIQVAIFFSMTTVSAYAEGSNDVPIIFDKKNKGQSGDRPRVPSMQQIYACIDNGNLYIMHSV